MNIPASTMLYVWALRTSNRDTQRPKYPVTGTPSHQAPTESVPSELWADSLRQPFRQMH